MSLEDSCKSVPEQRPEGATGNRKGEGPTSNPQVQEEHVFITERPPGSAGDTRPHFRQRWWKRLQEESENVRAGLRTEKTRGDRLSNGRMNEDM